VGWDFDLVVIGSGPAGEKGAAQAAYFGKRVAIVEKAPQPGGACVHTGTLPSKTMRETALFLSGKAQREVYGVTVTVDPAVAVPKLLTRKDAVRAAEVDRVRWNLDRHGITTVQGTATLAGANVVRVLDAEGKEQRISSEFILVATGSVPHRPPHIPFDDRDVDDSDTILELDRMPKDLVVLGAGVIGCEYASMFAALGVEVTIVEGRSEILGFLDADMSEGLRLAMTELGVKFILGDSANRVVREGSRIVTQLASGGLLSSEKLLFAAGRSGCTAGLGLEGVGVVMGTRGSVVVDDDFRTNVPSVFAAGDVVGFPALASTSMEQGRVAVCNMFGFTYKQEMARLWPMGIYTIPEVSAVGLAEEDAKAQGKKVVVGRGPYALNARGKIIGDTRGMVKLVFDAETRVLLGAHVIGDRATELVHIGQAIIGLGGTVDTIVGMVFNYPTLSECYKDAAYDALGRLAPQ
jgi:NAD(P) transhydrogenase